MFIKTQYNDRVCENENPSFTSLGFSTNGATGEEAIFHTNFRKVFAEKLSEKIKSSYVEAISFI